MEKDYKIIIADTNWWVSLVIKNYNNKFASLLLSPKLKFISSDELTSEIKATLSKERLQKFLNPGLIKNFWYQFDALVTTVTVTSIVSVCRDPDDIFYWHLPKIPMLTF